MFEIPVVLRRLAAAFVIAVGFVVIAIIILVAVIVVIIVGAVVIIVVVVAITARVINVTDMFVVTLAGIFLVQHLLISR